MDNNVNSKFYNSINVKFNKNTYIKPQYNLQYFITVTDQIFKIMTKIQLK